MIIESKEDYIAHVPEDLPIYFQPDFLNVVDERWTAYVSKTENGIEWMMPCLKRKKMGFTLIGPPELAHDNAIIPLKKDKNFTDNPSELGRYFSRLIINDRNGVTPQTLINCFNIQQKNRQLITLKTYSYNIKDLSKRMRNNIRKVKHFSIDSTDDVERFYKLYKSAFTRRQISPWKMNKVRSIYEKLKELFYTTIFIMSDNNGRDLVANWIVGYKDTIYGILSAKNYTISQRGSHEYMKWHICQTIRENYEYWDLGGSNIPGVKKFNIKMGADNIEYPLYVKYKPEWIGGLLKVLSKS